MAAAVEFRQAGKRDVADVEVETHADGVGRHQMLHIAVLIYLDLRIPRAGGKRAHHHRRPAFLSAQKLGN